MREDCTLFDFRTDFENDPEAAIIFSLRWQGWEICNDQELLLEEIAAFRRTMSLGEAARRATGQVRGILATLEVVGVKVLSELGKY
ncbi:hypothetical protein AK812_SmicGene44949 [Symbiodinium microadriaticum]|uniref:Uncharacterized protein n=1 Tax=Symbiodinium microadriaticum TaxID=2951 RepID=A0A1Q9BX99_SYMMI|nr:hypothetical protein AK812_SmicGene44949 [Symbiodinium microadriaticum]